MSTTFSQRVIARLNRLFGPRNRYFESLIRSPEEALEYSIRSGRVVHEQFAGWNDFTDKVVLDFGCGTGGKTLFYAQQGPRLTVGVDIQLPIKRATEYAGARRLKVEFLPLAENGRIPLPACSCDVVINSSVLEHLPDPAQTFRELRRILKSDGLLLNRWHPFRSRYGAHLWSAIGIPFAHLCFREADLVQVYHRTLQNRFGAIPAGVGNVTTESRTFSDLTYNLNRFSVRRMRETLEQAGFSLLERRYYVGTRRVRYPRLLPETCVDYVIDYEIQICGLGKKVRTVAASLSRNLTAIHETVPLCAEEVCTTRCRLTH